MKSVSVSLLTTRWPGGRMGRAFMSLPSALPASSNTALSLIILFSHYSLFHVRNPQASNSRTLSEA